MTALRLQSPSPAYSMDQQAMPIEPPKRLVVTLPEHERGRGADDLRRLDILNRRIAKPLPKGDKKAEKEREENLREREALEARPHIAADARWVRAANAESLALAVGRGEEVEEDRAGVKRILDRDPVLGLVRAGRLTLEQGDIGQAIRECYDRRGEDAGAVEFTGMPGGGHDHEHFIGNRFLRAKATYIIGQIEAAVLTGHYRTRDATLRQVVLHARFRAEKVETHVALTMLRAVCRDGKSLSSQGEGRALERNAKAFSLALDVAGAVIDGAG